MIAKGNKDKGILAKLLEQSIRILVLKECKKISNLKIDIISSSSQIIKGKIQKIHIFAEDIYYKNLLFDEFKLEASDLRINIKLKNKELYFRNNPLIKFKISLSQNSLKTILLSTNWNWIGNMISKEMLNQEKLEDLKIRNGQLLIKASGKNNTTSQIENIDITTEEGKVYLESKSFNKIIQIPIENKIYIKNVSIENNLINIIANSTINI